MTSSSRNSWVGSFHRLHTRALAHWGHAPVHCNNRLDRALQHRSAAVCELHCAQRPGKLPVGYIRLHGGAASFGSPGAGGAIGYADPAAGVGYGYVTSQMGTRLSGDPRDVALRDALYSAILA